MGASENRSFFYYMGKSVSYRIALRRSGSVSLMRLAAGGESCKAGVFRL